jgi:hypothetical protein
LPAKRKRLKPRGTPPFTAWPTMCTLRAAVAALSL